MRAAVLHAIEDIRIEVQPTPTPAADEVLIRVDSVGVCGSDLHYFFDGHSGSSQITSPTVIGHEFAGVVVQTGAGIDPARLGERVSVEPGIACRHCRECVAGRYNLCENMHFLGAAPINGALRQYISVPATNAFTLPDSVTADEAAMLEPLSVAMWANEKARVKLGDRVLVTGAGPVGILAAQVAAARGARDITVVDTNPARLDLTRQLGPFIAVDPATWTHSPAQVDVLIECSGSPQALASVVTQLAPAGKVILVGLGPDTVSFPMNIIQEREITIMGSHRYRGMWPAAIALVADGAIKLGPLITDHFGLTETGKALRQNREHPTSMKVIIHPNLATKKKDRQ
jgi:L-iditol 2-dehydrogenase